ncbi:MAG: hypothetical protein P9M00_04910 [Candidatus Tritonobacter lacicola]|nr:hypothetical protein [Candidatus Tritonobacter lacicola]
MRTISLDDRVIKSIKSSIDFKKHILLLSRDAYSKQLRELQKKYDMTTSQFLKKFNSGKLGDEPDWFDWLFFHQAYSHISKEIKTFRIAKL